MAVRSYWLDRVRSCSGGIQTTCFCRERWSDRSPTMSLPLGVRFNARPAWTTDASIESVPHHRPGQASVARPSRQTDQAPLLRFLSLQRFPAMLRYLKGPLSGDPASALVSPLRFSASAHMRWSPPATASNASRCRNRSFANRILKRGVPDPFNGIHMAWSSCQARRRSWGSILFAAFVLCTSHEAFPLHPTHLPFPKCRSGVLAGESARFPMLKL